MMFLSFIIALGLGVFSLIFFHRYKRIQWSLFLLNAFWQLYLVYKLFLSKGLTETLSLPFSFLGFGQVTLVWRNSELGFLFVGASVVLTFLFALFSFSYNDKKHATSIAPLWTILMGANLALFMAADWGSFILAWELMGWTSYFIISHGKQKSGEAGLYYMVLSLIGTATLLWAILLIISQSGSLLISDGLNVMGRLWQSNGGLVTFVAGLFTLTFFAKSAIFPFYMWPAKAHAEAPDDFSAFLSGVMIKYGVFGLLAIVLPLFGKNYVGPMIGSVPLFMVVLGWFGALTALWGTLLAIRENDMKRLMAYSTVSNLGFILAALAMNNTLGLAAALFHTLNHMLFKGGIFLSMASVKFRTGEREMHRLGGMAYRMPVTFFGFLIGIIAAAGIPPTSGFGSKWMVFQSLFQNKMFIMAIPIFLASTGAFLYLYRGLHSIYLGQLSPRFKDIKEAPLLQLLPGVIIMLLILAVGFFPGLILLPVNEVLHGITGTGIAADWSTISGVTSSVDLTVAGAIFLGAFIITFILFIIGKKRTYVGMMDNYTAGEDPEEWDLTPEKYHYAMHFYEPFEKMTAPLLKKGDMESVFSRIGYELGRVSRGVAGLFKSPYAGPVLLLGSVVAILILGGSL